MGGSWAMISAAWSRRWGWVREEKKGEMGLKGCGLGIVDGGFERSVSLAMWEWRIGDVEGEMGFVGMRESFALVDRVHVELKVGGGEVEWLGMAARLVGGWGTSNRRLRVGWSCISLSLVRGVELRGDGFRTPVLFLLSLSLSLSLSLFVSPGNHLKVKWECNWFYGWSGWFYSQQKWFSVWPNFSYATKHTAGCKMISWNAFQAKQTHP